MRALAKLTIFFLFMALTLCGQDAEIDRLISNEFKMTFPSIYFKHNSTDFATMPYSIDSCFKFISQNYKKDINSLVIWRDSIETERLTKKRIKKLRAGLRKYLRNEAIKIISMGQEQKISRRTIKMTADKAKIDYLLTLNSVFDISKTRIPPIKKKSKRRLVWTGWKTGLHWSD